MKVLFLPKYTIKGASSRLRTYQYLPYYKESGLDITVSPFFSNEYLQQVYDKKSHNLWLSLKSFVRRLAVLFTVFRYDRIVIEKELFPYFPAVFEILLNSFGVKYIVDYDDAIWHNYDESPRKWVRILLSKKINYVMRNAHAVVVGNQYIYDKAQQAGAKRIYNIPTVIDIDKYKQKEKPQKDKFVIGWIGSPITEKYLPLLKSVFIKLSKEFQIELHWLGAQRGLGLGEIEKILTWSSEKEAALIKEFDVGIMPLQDNIWERGKCGYKLIQYMGCGIPVVGTPIGVNKEIIQEGINGFQAENEQEWHEKLKFIILSKDTEVWKNMGQNGRKIVEEKYTLQANQGKWLEIIKK